MYQVSRHDRVNKLDGFPHICPGAPLPLLLANETKFALRCRLLEPLVPDAADSYAVLGGWGDYYFGSPNDEALEGHPLYKRGLESYGVYEVLHSSWIREAERRNRSHVGHNPARFDDFHHYIITFHDNLFECMSESLEILGTPSDIDKAMKLMWDWVGTT